MSKKQILVALLVFAALLPSESEISQWLNAFLWANAAYYALTYLAERRNSVNGPN
jgi:hypothetical protein